MKRGTSVALSQELELELEEPEEPPMVHWNHPAQELLRGPHPSSLPAQKRRRKQRATQQVMLNPSTD